MRASIGLYLDLGCGVHAPQSVLSLCEEIVQLCAQIKVQDKGGRLKKENDFLEEESIFSLRAACSQ